MGRTPLLLFQFPVHCECPGATWHHSAVRCPVIQPSLTDCQCTGAAGTYADREAFPSSLTLFQQTSRRVAAELDLVLQCLSCASGFACIFRVIYVRTMADQTNHYILCYFKNSAGINPVLGVSQQTKTSQIQRLYMILCRAAAAEQEHNHKLQLGSKSPKSA